MRNVCFKTPIFLLVFFYIFSWCIQVASAQVSLDEQIRADYENRPVQVPTQKPLAEQITTGNYTTQPIIDFAAIGSYIGNMVLQIGSMFAWLGGMLLDLAIDNLIVRMAEWIHDGGIGVVINNVWGVIRDISNIVFIFGFVYIGIKMIISPDSGRTKSFLAQLIIAALLINFSLFITKVVIDVSNVFAIEVYKLMAASAENSNIGVAFAKEMGLSGFFGTVSPGQLNTLTTSGSIVFFVMASVTLIIAGFVFAAAAVLIMIRFVALIFIMIFSPIMFAATVFPQTQGWANKFNSYLFRYAFFAPIFLFLIYISFRVLQSSTFGDNNNIASIIANPPTDINHFGVFLHFFMALVFIIASLTLASKLSLVGGQGVINMGQKLRGSAQGFIGRNTLGWASNKALEAYDRGEARGKGRFAKGLRTATNVASFGLTSDRNVRGALEGGKKAKFGGSYSFEDNEKYDKDQKARVADDKARIELERAIKAKDADAIERALNKMSAKQLEKMSAENLSDPLVMRHISNSNLESILKSNEFNEDEKLNFQKVRGEAIEKLLMEGAKQNETLVHVIGKATIAQLEDMGIERLMDNARGLSNSQMDDIKKSKKFTEIQFGKLSKKRVDDTKTYLDTPANATAFFNKIKTEDVEKTSKDILTYGPALRAIPISHVIAIKNSKKMDDADKNNILTNWEAEKIQQFNTNPKDVFQGISDKEKAHLPKSILTNSESYRYMTKDTLREMLKGSVEAGDRAVIRNNIMANPQQHYHLYTWLGTPQANEF